MISHFYISRASRGQTGHNGTARSYELKYVYLASMKCSGVSAKDVFFYHMLPCPCESIDPVQVQRRGSSVMVRPDTL